MRLLFIEETKIEDLPKPLQAGQIGYFSDPFAQKLIDSGKAVKIPNGMVLTETNTQFIIHQNQQKKKKAKAKE